METKLSMCEGCKACIYATPPSMYVRAEACPHNVKYVSKKVRVRVGQQKQDSWPKP
jgi:hypothetical protein